MSDVTRILSAIEQGDPHAAEQLLPLVYDELRKLAAQRLAHESPGESHNRIGRTILPGRVAVRNEKLCKEAGVHIRKSPFAAALR